MTWFTGVAVAEMASAANAARMGFRLDGFMEFYSMLESGSYVDRLRIRTECVNLLGRLSDDLHWEGLIVDGCGIAGLPGYRARMAVAGG